MRTHTLHRLVRPWSGWADFTACSASLSSPIGRPGGLPHAGKDTQTTAMQVQAPSWEQWGKMRSVGKGLHHMGSGTRRRACGQVGVTRPAEAAADPRGACSLGWREKRPGRHRHWVRQGYIGQHRLGLWGKETSSGVLRRGGHLLT